MLDDEEEVVIVELLELELTEVGMEQLLLELLDELVQIDSEDEGDDELVQLQEE